MFKRKRKNDETLLPKLFRLMLNSVQRILTITGLVTVLVLAILTLLIWPLYRPPVSNMYRYSTETPIPNQALSADIRLVLATARMAVFTNEATGVFHHLSTYALTMSYSPDHRWLTELGRGSVRLTSREPTNQELFERFSQFSGDALMPTWNADSDTFMFVARRGDSYILYSLSIKNPTVLVPRLIVPKLLAPPLFHPATGRILIAQPTNSGQTQLDTMNPNCTGPDSCMASLRSLATIPYLIDWATFHPNATTLIVSSMGKLYTVATASGNVTPFLDDGSSKFHPVFNRDGTLLAYLSGNKVHIVRLSDSSVIHLTFDDITSVEWAD